MSQTKRAYDKFLLYALLIIALGVVGFISATTVIDPNYLNTTGGVVAVTGTFSGALTGTTLDTGQGANELFDMDQNVLQASAVTFATVDTGQGANELYDMNQNVMTSSAVTFTTVNTGQGANELYDMDQNVLQASSVTFEDVTVTTDVTIGGITRTTWPSGTTAAASYVIFQTGLYTSLQDTDGTIITSTTDAYDAWSDAFDEIDSDGGGTISVGEGAYIIDGATHPTLSLPSAETYIIIGPGPPDDLSNPTSSGGAILMLENGARFIQGSGGNELITIDMGFGTASGDTWTDTAFDFFGAGPATTTIWLSYRCGYSIKGIHAAGSSTNPAGTPSGCVIAFGTSSGPTGIPYVWESNRFYDARDGDGAAWATTNKYNTLIMSNVERMLWINNYFSLQLTADMKNANLMYTNAVSTVQIIGLQLYPDGPSSGALYEHQFMCSGGSKHYYMEDVQLINPTHLNATSGSHFTQHGGGTLTIEGRYWHLGEGGKAPMLPTFKITNSGIIEWYPSGDGYEVYGNAEAGDNDTIAHGLVTTPSMCSLSVLESDSWYAVQPTVNVTHIVVNLYDITAAIPEAVDKTISYHAWVSVRTT